MDCWVNGAGVEGGLIFFGGEADGWLGIGVRVGHDFRYLHGTFKS